MRNNLAIVLTARMSSTRLPGKAMRDVADKPMIYWIIRRLQTIGRVVLATTKQADDDVLANYVTAMQVPVYRGSVDDVISRMDGAVNTFYPNAEFVLRGLGDCPFMTKESIDRMCISMEKYGGDFVVYALPPWIAPVYGSRESPYSREGWNKLVRESAQREHVDMYLHENRDKFRILYHEPPANIYFRPYRLEVDYPEDIAMLRALATVTPLQSSTETIIKTLDAHPEIADINRSCVEVTGLTRYTRKQQRDWMVAMRGKAIVSWDNFVWNPPGPEAEPIYCNGGTCLLGYGYKGMLHRMNGDIIKGDALVACKCGTNKRWRG